ncbi:MAG: cbb3-type cytochrome c oxidase subunit II [Polyangiaceae bacterium]
MEKVATIMLAAGVGCFGLAGFVSGYLPLAHLGRIPMKTVEQIVTEPSYEWTDLSKRFPDAFKKYYGEPTVETYRTALKLGRDTYIAEACWHCHSQYVRPVSNEEMRFGKVSYAEEYQNEMFLPHLFGTRRVGPDLIRESGKHGNDWHVAHFYDPTIVVPSSVMPRYTWFYDGETPNKKGLAVIAYVQWLGSWATPEAIARKEREEAKNGDAK